MTSYKKILLRLNSNLENYKIEVFGCEEYFCKIIKERKACLVLTTNSPCLRVVLSPLKDDYYTILYYKLDTENQLEFNLSYNFSKKTITPIKTYTFYLTDKNYGLKLNGKLFFNPKLDSI